MPHYKDIPLFKDVKEEEWNDWHWQWKNRIEDVDTLSKVIDLTPEAKEGIETALSKVKMAITPYYASLIDPDDPNCPVRMQAVPRGQEAQQLPWEFYDPLAEDEDSPVPGLTHRYPDRVLFLVTQQCSMYCRHCTRRRVVGVTDKMCIRDSSTTASSSLRATCALSRCASPLRRSTCRPRRMKPTWPT